MIVSTTTEERPGGGGDRTSAADRNWMDFIVTIVLVFDKFSLLGDVFDWVIMTPDSPG